MSYDSLITALENISVKALMLKTVKQRLLAEESKRSDRMGSSCEDRRSIAFVGRGKINAAVRSKSDSFMITKMPVDL